MKPIRLSVHTLQDLKLMGSVRTKFAILLTFLVLLCYGNTAFNHYSVDDNLIVDGNIQAEAGLAGIPDIFVTNYFTHGDKQGSYRAIPRATFALEVGLFGKRPAISHLLNVFMFLLSCWLLFRLLELLFPSTDGLAIFVSVLLFALHPLHTEVVASLKNRDELMQLMFCLLASIQLVKYARSGIWRQIVLSALAFLAALACKESAVQYLAVFPILFYYAGKVRKNLAVNATLAVLASGIFFMLFQYLVLNPEAIFWMATAKEQFPFIEHPLMHTDDVSIKLGTAFYGLGYYLRLFVFPHPLGFFYGFDQIELVPITHIYSLLTMVLLAGLLIISIKGLKSRAAWSLGILIMLICLSIFSNLVVQVSGVVAERFAYSSSLGFCILVGWTLQYLIRKTSAYRRLVLVGTLMVVLSAFGVATAERNTHWKTYLTLTQHDAATFTESAITHFYLALYINDHVLDSATVSRENWMRKAAFHYAEVARIHPPTVQAARYAAELYLNELNRPDSAALLYANIIDHTRSNLSKTDLSNYARSLMMIEHWNDARTTLKLGIEHFPEFYPFYELNAQTLLRLDEVAALAQFLNLTESRFPGSILPSVYRGNLFLKEADLRSAIASYRAALKLEPDNQQLRQFLIQLYTENGMHDAVSELKNEQP